ncbi:MAG: aspartate 1-decarboxylase [Dehalococcoidia bacterium]|nr:aspartate 1-decarboxylase [Dehalococcoidia bacterium]
MRTMLKSKIHRARVTQVNLDYEGSITIDRLLMEAGDLYPYEKVDVLNVNNGARFSTYVIEGEAGSGIIGLNGAAARMAVPNDLVIIVSYRTMSDEEARTLQPVVVHVDGENRIR